MTAPGQTDRLADDPCAECLGWPGHHRDCSLYGIPRTEAGQRLLATLESAIYNGRARPQWAGSDIAAIEDEAVSRYASAKEADRNG